MPDFDPQKPRYVLSIAGKDYEVEGTFGLIEAVEYAIKDNILSVAARCPGMAVSDIARLLAAILNASGEKTSANAIGNILWNDVGITTEAYAMLCLHVHAFLRITMAKPSERAEVAKQMGELLGRPDSPGLTTSDSV